MPSMLPSDREEIAWRRFRVIELRQARLEAGGLEAVEEAVHKS